MTRRPRNAAWLDLAAMAGLILSFTLAHAALSFALLRSLPVEVTFGMRVGPSFVGMWERLGEGG